MNAIKFSPSAQNFAQTQQTAMKPRQMAFRAEEEAAAEIMPEIQSEQQPKEGMSTVAKAGITAAVAVAACLTRGAVKTKAITGKFLGEGLLKNSNLFTKAFWESARTTVGKMKVQDAAKTKLGKEMISEQLGKLAKANEKRADLNIETIPTIEIPNEKVKNNANKEKTFSQIVKERITSPKPGIRKKDILTGRQIMRQQEREAASEAASKKK